MADARGRDAHEHLARLRRGELDLLDANGAPARGERRRESSSDPPALERVEVGRDAEPRPGRRRDRPVRGDLDGAGRSQSRRSADHAGGSNGTSTYGHRRDREREVQVGDEPVAVRPGVRATMRGRARSASAASRRQPADPAARARHRSAATSTPPRSTRSRASCARAHHLAGGEPQRREAPQRRVALEVVGAAAAPRASRRRAARARARTARRSRRPSAARGRRACASPGSRRP